MIEKTGINKYIRNEICRLLRGRRFGLKIESLEFLSDDADRNSVDLLMILSTLYHQSSWHFLPRIADFVVISPFRNINLFTEDYINIQIFRKASHSRI